LLLGPRLQRLHPRGVAAQPARLPGQGDDRRLRVLGPGRPAGPGRTRHPAGVRRPAHRRARDAELPLLTGASPGEGPAVLEDLGFPRPADRMYRMVLRRPRTTAELSRELGDDAVAGALRCL